MPRLRTSHPTLNLEQVELLTQSQSPAHEYFHFFGIFKKEAQYACGTCWDLFDEYKQINVKLNGDLATYIRPKSGDIIRVHRAKVNTISKIAEIPVPKNVVIWSGFEEDPQGKTVANRPTVTEDDTERCKALQIYYTSQITRICELSRQVGTGTAFLTLAGRLEDKIIDSFGHLEIKFTDGTGEQQMRIFNKISPIEDDTHYTIARNMNNGEYFIANNVKYDRSTRRIQLSANTLYGRSFRLVERRSVLGIVLSSALKEGVDQENNQASEQQVDLNSFNQQPEQIGSGQPKADTVSGRRRSPRLLSHQQNQDSSNSQTSNSSSVSQHTSLATLQLSTQSSMPQAQPTKKPHLATDNQATTRPLSQIRPESPVINLVLDSNRNYRMSTNESMPSYKKLSDIKPRDTGYDFFDIVGQVRAEPVLTKNYNNCILQIYDGSKHNHSSYYNYEVERVMPECVLIQIYSKQKEQDTDEHIEKAKKLREGELVLIKNVKISFRAGKLKLELSANKSHDKSISVIDKDSLFGRKLLDIIENPIVEGLDEQIEFGSLNDSRYTQNTDNFLMDIS